MIAAGDRQGDAWTHFVLRRLRTRFGTLSTKALEVAGFAGRPAGPLGTARPRRSRARTSRRAEDALVRPPMPPTSMATARFMETWAHALDVHDAPGRRPPGHRPDPARRPPAYAPAGSRSRSNGLEPPPAEFRVELTALGRALDLGSRGRRAVGPRRRPGTSASPVTQRVHRDDTGLVATGPDDAEKWLTIAQAFAGPPVGREARA